MSNDNFPPSHDTDPRGDVVQQMPCLPSPGGLMHERSTRLMHAPEISQVARDAARDERHDEECEIGVYVQRAIDAAVAECHETYLLLLCGRLGLSEERSIHRMQLDNAILALKRIRELTARCEKLEKALEKIIGASDGGYVIGLAKEALNQSPE